jgi:2,3-bisphosphoglycerate-independent phosphoglycerate mutase
MLHHTGAGVTGLMDSVEPGRACGSDTAHLGIFGYDPRKTYRGRGAFESMGAGCQVEPGDIAFKCNFATIDDSSGIVTHRRVDRTFDEEGPVLCDFLDGANASSFPHLQVKVWQCIATSVVYCE